jgi:hypothetical protein
MGNLTGIVPPHAVPQIVGQTDVKALRLGFALDDVKVKPALAPFRFTQLRRSRLDFLNVGLEGAFVGLAHD